MNRALTQLITLGPVVLILALPAWSEVILDDDFDGTTVSALWDSAGATVSGGQVHLTATSEAYLDVEFNQMYHPSGTISGFYGVTAQSADFSLGFGRYLAGYLRLHATSGGDMTIHLQWSQPSHLAQGVPGTSRRTWGRGRTVTTSSTARAVCFSSSRTGAQFTHITVPPRTSTTVL